VNVSKTMRCKCLKHHKKTNINGTNNKRMAGGMQTTKLKRYSWTNKTKTVFIKKRTGNVKTISVTANVQHNRLVVQMSVYNGKYKIYMRC